MPEQCKICLTSESEWKSNGLEGHIRSEHGNNEASVSAMYDDRFDHIFEDGDSGGGVPETGTGPSTPPSPGSSGGQSDGGPGTEQFGKKWYMIGIGGAGNNILDAILMRRDTLRAEDEDRELIWRGGLAGYGLLNTNIAELEKTYYAREENGYSPEELVSNSIIGKGEHENDGMGYRWQNGAKVAAADFEGETNPFQTRWDMRTTDIQDAQAIMMIQSVTKGTGCGATPVIADKIREHVVGSDSVVGKAILSSVVIPSEGDMQSDVGGRAKTNGVVGLARTAQAVDAIIPFNNSELRKASKDIKPRIDGLDRYGPPKFSELNKPLVAFLEAFTMSSTLQSVDRDATMSIRGSVFDVADSFRLVEDKYPASMADDDRPAVVLAPALGRLVASDITASKLEILAQKTIQQNQFAEFDPSTAWGGNFMLYGPPEKMEQVSEYVTDGTVQEIINGEDFLDAEETAGVETVDVQLNQLVTPYLDDVYMWGMLWNPEMPALKSMYEHAKRLEEEGQTEQAENVRDVWEDVDSLFGCLGRDNML